MLRIKNSPMYTLTNSVDTGTSPLNSRKGQQNYFTKDDEQKKNGSKLGY